MPEPSKNADLAALRARLDALDHDLLRLLARRLGVVSEVAEVKRAHGIRIRDLARERAVPPYLIFNDRTLAGMAARKPSTPEELLAIRGVGEKKAADLGPAFLERIAKHAAADTSASDPA